MNKPKPTNKDLWDAIEAYIELKYKKRWSSYYSELLVQWYKSLGGKFTGLKEKSLKKQIELKQKIKDESNLPPFKPIKLRSFFSRVGGKTKLANIIYKYFPKDYKNYVEPFIGGGSLYLKVPLDKVRIINDLDKDIYDLWNDLKNLSEKDINSIDIEKYKPDREQFNYFKENNFTNKKERFIRNMYLSKFSFGGQRDAYSTSKRNTALFDKKLVMEIKKNLENTIILNTDYKNIIKKYDSNDTFFYLDPPYELTKDYVHNDIEKNDLLKTLLNIKGKFIMSYNYSKENIDLFSKYFKVIILDNILYSRNNIKSDYSKKKNKEILVMNYK